MSLLLISYFSFPSIWCRMQKYIVYITYIKIYNTSNRIWPTFYWMYYYTHHLNILAQGKTIWSCSLLSVLGYFHMRSLEKYKLLWKTHISKCFMWRYEHENEWNDDMIFIKRDRQILCKHYTQVNFKALKELKRKGLRREDKRLQNFLNSLDSSTQHKRSNSVRSQLYLIRLK